MDDEAAKHAVQYGAGEASARARGVSEREVRSGGTRSQDSANAAGAPVLAIGAAVDHSFRRAVGCSLPFALTLGAILTLLSLCFE
jgi:hypothetical protein